jgi:hypothetical protein
VAAACYVPPIPPILTTPSPAPMPGWYSADTRIDGTVSVNSSQGGAPSFSCNAVELSTGANSPVLSYPDKAQMFTYAQAGTSLNNITTVGYWPYRATPPSTSTVTDTDLNVEIYRPVVLGTPAHRGCGPGL